MVPGRAESHSARATVVEVLDRAQMLPAALSLKRRLESLSAKVRTLTQRPLRRRIARAAAAGDHLAPCVMFGWPLLATVRSSYRATDAADRHRELVLAACEATPGLRYFESVSPRTGRQRIGIVGDRQAFLASLREVGPGAAVAIEDGSGSLPKWIESVALTSQTMRHWAPNRVLCVFDPATSPNGGGPLGLDAACEVEVWGVRTNPAGPTELVTELVNPVANHLPIHVMEPPQDEAVDNARRFDVEAFDWPLTNRPVPFPVDVVYTWVDGADPAWLRRVRQLDASGAASDGVGEARFGHAGALRYSLRSLWYYVSYIRKIYLVTDAQRPDWLRADERIVVVDHRDIYKDRAALPVFNSHAIESQLHNIPGLSEHYLYLNDDVFFGRPSHWSEYFTPAGLPCFFESLVRIPVAPDDDAPGIDYAGINAQRILVDMFGWASNRKVKHTPHAQRRTIHEELEQRLPEVYARVARSRFRSRQDVSVAAYLHHRYAEATGRGVASETETEFVDLRRPDLGPRLTQLHQQSPASFCLNDADMPTDDRVAAESIVHRFLAERFPFPAPWE